MSIALNYPTVGSPTATWTPSKPPKFPVRHAMDFPEQVRGETMGGMVYVQKKGASARETFEVVFDYLPQSDRDQAASFFSTINKSAEVFDFTDSAGTVHQVRWMNDFDFSQAAQSRYSGTLKLRKE